MLGQVLKSFCNIVHGLGELREVKVSRLGSLSLQDLFNLDRLCGIFFLVHKDKDVWIFMCFCYQQPNRCLLGVSIYFHFKVRMYYKLLEIWLSLGPFEVPISFIFLWLCGGSITGTDLVDHMFRLWYDSYVIVILHDTLVFRPYIIFRYIFVFGCENCFGI